MAIIYSYPKTAPLAADLLIVSRQPSDPDETANYSVSVSDIATLVTGLQQYTLKAGTKAGTSVPLTLDSDTGTDSTVNFTEGSNITLTQTSATEITIASSGGATSLNGLTDALIDGTSTYLVSIPAGLSGNPSHNTIIGNGNATALTTAGSNTIVGRGNATSLNTGISNIVIGGGTGTGITNSSSNILIGNAAGPLFNAGSSNIIIGNSAMTRPETYSNNVAIGHNTLFLAGLGGTTCEENTAIGVGAGGTTYRSGSNNTILGYDADTSAASVDNEFTLGNSSVATLRCAVTSITSLSDARDKTDIKDLSYGVDFIKSLTPREFTWNNRPEIRVVRDEEGNETEKEIESKNKGKKDFGFVAQEVQALDNDTLRLIYNSNPEKLEMSYGKLVPILVQAVKELTARLEALEN
jgi:hypothetical protein